MMKALRFHGKGDLRLEDVEIPQCGKDQIKVLMSKAFTKPGSLLTDHRSNPHLLAFAELVRVLNPLDLTFA